MKARSALILFALLTTAVSSFATPCPVGTIETVLNKTCTIGLAQFYFWQFNSEFFPYEGEYSWAPGPAPADIEFIPDGSDPTAPKITVVANMSVTDHEYEHIALYFDASSISASRYFSGVQVSASGLEVGPGIYADALVVGSLGCGVGIEHQWENGVVIQPPLAFGPSCTTSDFPKSTPGDFTLALYSFYSQASVASFTFVYDMEKQVPVPEPTSILLLGVGFVALSAKQLRKI